MSKKRGGKLREEFATAYQKELDNLIKESYYNPFMTNDKKIRIVQLKNFLKVINERKPDPNLDYYAIREARRVANVEGGSSSGTNRTSRKRRRGSSRIRTHIGTKKRVYYR